MVDPALARFTPYPYDAVPTTVNGYAIPDQRELRGRFFAEDSFDLSLRLGILYVQLEAEESIAVMPVAGNTQPIGLMHGGAYCVLGESLGSLSAATHAGEDHVALGIDLNATHTGSTSRGFVTGVCRAIHLGRTMAVHEIVISDENGRRCSTVRITNAIRTRKRD